MEIDEIKVYRKGEEIEAIPWLRCTLCEVRINRPHVWVKNNRIAIVCYLCAKRLGGGGERVHPLVGD